MDEAQKEYLARLTQINQMRCSKQNKCKLIQGLIAMLKDDYELSKPQDTCKNRVNTDNLSTSISCCESLTFDRDIDELQESILQKQIIKIQANQEIETLEEQLFELDKIVEARREYNDHLKKKIDCKMKRIARQKQIEQHSSSSSIDREQYREQSYLDRSFNTVTGLFKIAKWW